ncbi:MAG: hypothetical protein RLZZ417_2517, partial [Bacteroidota bacterium]
MAKSGVATPLDGLVWIFTDTGNFEVDTPEINTNGSETTLLLIGA